VDIAGWTIDLAREQALPVETLSEWLQRSAASGYNAVGLYLEHRFEYPSAPAAAGPGCLTVEGAKSLSANSPVRVIPFLNTLGHMEGFMRTEGLQWLSEGPSDGSAQMCPSRPECVEFARDLVQDSLSAFSDEWVHLGGDETRQLGQCEICSGKGKAQIYSEYFASLCSWVLSQGRRPCLWADMLIEHPSVLEYLPKETVLFDWQYHQSPKETSTKLRAAGFDVVCCPAVHTYDSAWCYIDETYENVDQHIQTAREVGALGVFVTTWEFSYFTNYFSTLPIIFACGRRLRGEQWDNALLNEGGPEYFDMAQKMGRQILGTSEFIGKGWRRIRQNMVLSQDPFGLWRVWREATGEVGDDILAICDSVKASSDEVKFPAFFYAFAVQWIRACEGAYRLYGQRKLRECSACLRSAAGSFDELVAWMESFAKLGGSSADVERANRLKQRILDVADIVEGTSDHFPAFEVLSHSAYVRGDQAAWRTGQY
jgi:hypothetical protein